MDIQKIEQYTSAFDAIVKIVKDEDGNEIEKQFLDMLDGRIL